MIRSCTPSSKFVFSTCATTDHLVVGLVLNPTAGVSSDEHLSDFIIGEDDEREGLEIFASKNDFVENVTIGMKSTRVGTFEA